MALFTLLCLFLPVTAQPDGPIVSTNGAQEEPGPPDVHCGPAVSAVFKLTDGSRRHPSLCRQEAGPYAFLGVFCAALTAVQARVFYVDRRAVFARFRR